MNNSKKVKEKKQKKSFRTPAGRNQGRNLLQTVGLTLEEQLELEKKLQLIKYFDLFSEQTFNIIYKNQFMEKKIVEFEEIIGRLGTIREEDKLLKQNYERKQIKDIILNLKNNAEKIALSKGYNKSFSKRYRNYNLYLNLPILAIFGVFTLLQFLGIDLMLFMFPLICLLCCGPQILRGRIMKNWHEFKEQNKNQLYTENRDDLLILREYTNEILQNIRQVLIEKRIPLQIIKFQLLSNDYDNLKILGNYPIRNAPGETQYLVSFEYPPGMEPFPLPEGYNIPEKTVKSSKIEKNFIILTQLKAKDGVIYSFIPSLRDMLAPEINDTLNACQFNQAPLEFSSIIPEYPQKNAIYCPCGEIVQFSSTQICNWENIFKFYLFEGKPCECGEKIYVLSLMNDDDEIPDALRIIFIN